jgi:hypothetical protein
VLVFPELSALALEPIVARDGEDTPFLVIELLSTSVIPYLTVNLMTTSGDLSSEPQMPAILLMLVDKILSFRKRS